MPELRRDPVAGRWVIIASERAKRPDDFAGELAPTPRNLPCAFCAGNESMTPQEIMAVRSGGAWKVRVVANKFPALMVEGDLSKRGDGMYDLMNGVGAHEVIIESPRHEVSITSLNDGDVRDVLWLYKQRLLDLRNDYRLVYGLVFKNVKDKAGASMEHTHSQLIATPIVPLQVEQEIRRCSEYFDYRGRCLLCDMVMQEMQSGARMVMDSPNFIAFEPFAARFPFETHLMPKRHMSHFEATDDALLPELARVLRTSIAKIEAALNQPPYNYLIHTSPLNVRSLDHYHWHFEIIPRITRVAGFEWGSGFYINTVPPEQAAAFLREVRA
ncbi:MAG TPA: galactose-1-phosphate uridylyltransferase [Planctomycetota bacterium]|nr:galactose-1-phosphate uridylyltransferase [Planctomycetota bacterium]